MKKKLAFAMTAVGAGILVFAASYKRVARPVVVNTVTGIALMFTSLETGRPVGFGLVCAEARYCCFKLAGAKRIERRVPTLTQWRTIEAELVDGLGSDPIPMDSPLASIFAVGPNTRIRYLHVAPINATPADAAETLDTYLERQAGIGLVASVSRP